MLEVLLIVFLGGVAICDFGCRRIPNAWLGAGALAWAVAWAGGLALPVDAPLTFLAGLAGVLLALLPAYALRVMGAGDVKLALVLALWFSWPSLLSIWVLASMLAAVHGLTLLLVRWAGHRKALQGMASMWTQPQARRREIPYGAYLALGALLTMAATR